MFPFTSSTDIKECANGCDNRESCLNNDGSYKCPTNHKNKGDLTTKKQLF